MSARLQAIRQAARLVGFHRDQHHSWRRAALLLVVTNILTLVVTVGYMNMHSTVYVTVAATSDGRLVPLTQLSEPIMTDAALKTWTVTAVTEAFTLGHHDWRMRLGAVRESFTDRGYESFVNGLEESRFLERIRERLQVSSSVARGVPVVTSTFLHGDRLVWQIEFPLLVTFEAGSKTFSQELVAEVLVMRVPLWEREAGIAIEQLIATRGRDA